MKVNVYRLPKGRPSRWRVVAHPTRDIIYITLYRLVIRIER